MPVVSSRLKNESSSSDQVIDSLEVALLQKAFALRHHFGRRSHLHPHLPEEPSHRRHEVDRQQQDHQADEPRAANHPVQERLRLFGRCSGGRPRRRGGLFLGRCFLFRGCGLLICGRRLVFPTSLGEGGLRPRDRDPRRTQDQSQQDPCPPLQTPRLQVHCNSPFSQRGSVRWDLAGRCVTPAPRCHNDPSRQGNEVPVYPGDAHVSPKSEETSILDSMPPPPGIVKNGSIPTRADQFSQVRVDRGREGRLSSRPPLPPNRTGGFPASGSPVSGVTS